MAAAPVYCLCQQPYDVNRFMIECDVCKDWFHGSCVRVEEHQAVDIDLYHCPNCAALHGVSLMRKRKNWHRHDYTEVDEHVKPVQAGTSVFVRELQARSFPSADEIIIRMHGAQLTQKYLEKHGFEFPIMLSKIDGLGISLPPNNFSVREVEEYVGGDKVIDVIDVARQADSKMKLHDFVKYYTDPHRNKVLNVISLEFSDTKMAELVEVPDIVKKLSWVENYWPEDSFFPKPYVQKYCLMGVKDSYTDFHIDFGGTSVWYHVLWGEKIFYLIKPTNANLALYESWSSSVNQSEVFFGDRVDRCYKCVVRQGNTLLIPTGWIHGVITSKDCMAFGGNFLHNLNIRTQIRVYEMEKRLKTPELFKFPYFEAICWYVAKSLQETLKELREDNCQPQNYMVEGIKYLIPALKSWIQKEVLMEHTYEIPDQIRPGQLIKELDKEIRFLEDMSIGSKPVKSQGIVGTMPIMRVSQDKSCSFSVSPGKRRIRRLRDPSNKVHSDLDILELHTREVLKKMEMAQWGEEDVSNSKFKMKISRTSQPSSTVPEKNPNDNNLRLVLSNGRIISDVRHQFTEFGLCSANSEEEEEEEEEGQRASGQDETDSSDWEDEKQESQKPLNKFFESVKTELRNGVSKYSDLSDSDESQEESSIQGSGEEDSWDEESHHSDHSEKNGSMYESETERSQQAPDKPRTSLKRCKKGTTIKRERPPSPGTEEAIQGMLSMATLHYPDRQSDPMKSSESMDKRSLHRSRQHTRTNTSDEEELSPYSRASEWVCPVKQGPVHNIGALGESAEEGPPGTAVRQDEQVKMPKLIRKECSAATSHKIQENKNFMEELVNREWWTNTSESITCTSGAERIQGEGRLNDHHSRSLDHIQPISPPMHPSSKRALTNPPPVSNQATKGKRPKKGMATAKQRLGKILKLNRSGRLFL
ncbi:lysine-specific demethylase 7B isoform X2 [Callorhinchus milii]|uniref:lysine-specific demethylase 7B isoform X2 n=1 Tax=Callorhinchus milii TaxID=7868 RepID=UPI001C3FAA9D|nr:lysine-specific demethylase 7B isoform X2 [Callorhinchus milii]